MSNKYQHVDSIWEHELKSQAQQQNIQAASKELTLLNDLYSKNIGTPSCNSVNQSEIEHLLSTQYSSSSQLDSTSKRSSSIQSFQDSVNNPKLHHSQYRYQHDLNQRNNIPAKQQANNYYSDSEFNEEGKVQDRDHKYNEQVTKNSDYIENIPKHKHVNMLRRYKSTDVQTLNQKVKNLKTNQEHIYHHKRKTKNMKLLNVKNHKEALNTFSQEDEEEILQVLDMVNIIVRATGFILIISLTLAFLQSEWTRKILFSQKQISFYKYIHNGVFKGIRTIMRMIFIERSQKAQVILCLALIDLSLFTYKNQQLQQNHRVPKWLKYF